MPARAHASSSSSAFAFLMSGRVGTSLTSKQMTSDKTERDAVNNERSKDIYLHASQEPWVQWHPGIGLKLLRVTQETGHWTILVNCSKGSSIPRHEHLGAGEYIRYRTELNEAISGSVSVGGCTVYRTKRRFVEGNLDLALSEEARAGDARKLSHKETALLVATVCSSRPESRKRWTLDLLASGLTEHDALSREAGGAADRGDERLQLRWAQSVRQRGMCTDLWSIARTKVS
jgi:transposase